MRFVVVRNMDLGLGDYRSLEEILPRDDWTPGFTGQSSSTLQPNGTYLVVVTACPHQWQRTIAYHGGKVRLFAISFHGPDRLVAVLQAGGLAWRLRAPLQVARLQAEASVKAALDLLRAELAAVAESGPGSEEYAIRRVWIATLRMVIAALITPLRSEAAHLVALVRTLAAGGKSSRFVPLA